MKILYTFYSYTFSINVLFFLQRKGDVSCLSVPEQARMRRKFTAHAIYFPLCVALYKKRAHNKPMIILRWETVCLVPDKHERVRGACVHVDSSLELPNKWSP